MRRRELDRKPVGRVELDLCFDCHAIWFDQYESLQLTPGAVMTLFREIHEQPSRSARPLADRLPCPQCRKSLRLTNDIQRGTRIAYYRCAEGHGRLSTFTQFLREKNFIRDLTHAEIERLRASVKQVRCTSCGGPVDIARDAACPYCRAAVAILDPDAVARTLAELSAAERRRTTPDPAAALDALLAGQRIERRLAAIEGRAAPAAGPLDLVAEVLDIFLD